MISSAKQRNRWEKEKREDMGEKWRQRKSKDDGQCENSWSTTSNELSRYTLKGRCSLKSQCGSLWKCEAAESVFRNKGNAISNLTSQSLHIQYTSLCSIWKQVTKNQQQEQLHKPTVTFMNNNTIFFIYTHYPQKSSGFHGYDHIFVHKFWIFRVHVFSHSLIIWGNNKEKEIKTKVRETWVVRNRM